jgi:hypothetical protein
VCIHAVTVAGSVSRYDMRCIHRQLVVVGVGKWPAHGISGVFVALL